MITSPKLLIGLTLLFAFVNWIFSIASPEVGGWGIFEQLASGTESVLDFSYWWNVGHVILTSITWNYSILNGTMFGTVVKVVFVCISMWIVLSFLFETAKFIRGFIPFLGS